jgi:HAD superfamily hydrolase (TIGR01509 family)
MSSESIEALLFDLGGVIIKIDFGRCLRRWATSAGCAVEDIASRFTFDAAYEDHERGTIDAAEYFAGLRRSLSLDLTDDALLEGWNDVYVGPDAEVVDLLVQARTRFPLYAFTNTNPSHQTVWSRLFARELEVFDSIFVSSEIGHRKPDRAAFEAVASMIDVSPSRILFFDDGPENVEGARKAGLQAVHVTSADSVRAALSLLDPSLVVAHAEDDRSDI